MPTTTTRIANPTKNDLPEEVRERVIGLLQASLADAADLQFQAKTAHWNVKGASFIALHELFDRAYAEAVVWTDDIAERIVQLGGVAEGTVQAIAGGTRLGPYPLGIRAGHDHVEAFSTALARFGAHVREAIDAADQAGDADTADLFTGVSRAVDKMLWFVEAHNHYRTRRARFSPWPARAATRRRARARRRVR
jgi:starvation-inducible DNA-binding protein